MTGFLWFLLNVVQAVSTVIWSAGWIAAALVVRGVTRDTRIPLAMARHLWSPGLLRIGGVRWEVEGLDNVDFSRPHFFAANHQSIVDTLTLYRVLPVPLLFILKEELRRVPFLGWYVAAMGMIFLPRGQRRRSLQNLELCRRRLDQGHSILMFPEGTRSRDGRIGPFKPSIFLPAIDTGVSVVPVAMDGAGKIIPPGGFRLRPGTVRIALGRPVETSGLGREDRRALAQQVRERMLEQWQALQERRPEGWKHPDRRVE